jgi:hypothetical protein
MTQKAQRLGGKCAALAGLALASVVVFGVAHSAPRGQDPKGPAGKFHSRLLEIARSYEAFGRVDDEARWAPYYCRMPSPARAQFSASKEAGTHGQKLYSLFAKDRWGYLAVGAVNSAQKAKVKPADQQVGQVLVKQSWIPKEVPDDGKQLQAVIRRVQEPIRANGKKADALGMRDSFLPYARKNGKLYHAEKQADLFIMYKLDPATPDTDKGWVYGTVTPDGKTVTSAGRVAACMKCHEKAKCDRLFGFSPKP